jgi:hypothetical protein
MLKTGSSLADFTAYIYDDNDCFLLKTRVTKYDSKTREIEIAGNPGLKKGAQCKVVIETTPLPYEYMGRVTTVGMQPFNIALYNERRQTSEHRQYQRFKANTPAKINHFIFNGCAYLMKSPLTVSLVDISQSGLRIRSDGSILILGNRYELQLRMGEKNELLIIEVMNCNRVGATDIEYGCKLCSGYEDA